MFRKKGVSVVVRQVSNVRCQNMPWVVCFEMKPQTIHIDDKNGKIFECNVYIQASVYSCVRLPKK